MDLNKFASDKLKELRVNKFLTQEELAENLNITQQQVARYENNQRQFKLDFLFQLAEYFNISINEFFPSINTYTSDFLSDKMGDEYVSMVKLSVMTDISVKELENTLSPENKLPKPSILKKISDALNTDYEDVLITAGYIEDPQDIDNNLYKSGIRYLLDYDERMIICNYLSLTWSEDEEKKFKENPDYRNEKIIYTPKKVYDVIFSEDKKEFSDDEVKEILNSNGFENKGIASLFELPVPLPEFSEKDVDEINSVVSLSELEKQIEMFEGISKENREALINMLEYFYQKNISENND